MFTPQTELPRPGWRRTLYTIIFESDTTAGRRFDQLLILTILLSLLTVILESVTAIRQAWGTQLATLDWVFTILFTIEYALRLLCAPRPARYARSFFGVVDLLSILPLYIGLLIPESRVLVDIRVLRLLRMFRIFKLTRYVGEASELWRALTTSRRKIAVFMGTVVLLEIVLGTLMYVIEGEAHGFTSIPVGIYWAIVTMTTVGFGDITPKTPLGQAVASVVMIIGYGIIAVPTGIVSAELARGPEGDKASPPRRCPHCASDGHASEARYCKDCGAALAPPDQPERG